MQNTKEQQATKLKKIFKPLYPKIHQQLKRKWFQYIVLFFIVGSISSIIYSSFEEAKPYRAQLFLFNYISSFVFTIEYVLRLIAAPMQYPQLGLIKARLKYMFSFYGIIDFVAILPFVVIYFFQDSPHLRHYKIFCVNGNTGFRNESRIFYFIHLQNEEDYERKESSSA